MNAGKVNIAELRSLARGPNEPPIYLSELMALLDVAEAARQLLDAKYEDDADFARDRLKAALSKLDFGGST